MCSVARLVFNIHVGHILVTINIANISIFICSVIISEPSWYLPDDIIPQTFTSHYVKRALNAKKLLLFLLEAC